VGYPTVDGSKSYFHLENPIAITSACTDSAAAWEFVRTFLTDSYQNIEQGIGLPTNKAAFDAYAAKMMTIEYTTDSEGNQIEVSRGTVKLDDIISIQLYAVSEREFTLFNDLYENCSHMNRNNQTLFDMINAEVSTMLNGQTAEDTAAAIQTAVEAYLNQLK
jgi:ABC-type glycerol-3-phosphate transport system substrate-binding protein